MVAGEQGKAWNGYLRRAVRPGRRLSGRSSSELLESFQRFHIGLILQPPGLLRPNERVDVREGNLHALDVHRQPTGRGIGVAHAPGERQQIDSWVVTDDRERLGYHL